MMDKGWVEVVVWWLVGVAEQSTSDYLEGWGKWVVVVGGANLGG